MNPVFSGKAFVTGHDVSAYQISSPARWAECGTDADSLGRWLFEPLEPSFSGVPGGFKALDYRIVVSGVDLGGGFKSIDHPVLTFKGAGVTLLIAESFNRIFFRNAVNLGMPVLTCPGVLALAKTGDKLIANLESGLVTNETTGETLAGVPMSALALALEEAGGLLPYWRERLTKN